LTKKPPEDSNRTIDNKASGYANASNPFA